MAGKINDELQMSRPISSIDLELYLNLLYTSELATHAEYRLLKEHGLQRTQYNVLRILRGAGETGLPCGSITERMLTQVPDMTRLIDRLETQGLVERQRGAEDRRVVRVVITEAGKDCIAPLDRILPKMQRRCFRKLKAADKQKLIDSLELIRESLD